MSIFIAELRVSKGTKALLNKVMIHFKIRVLELNQIIL